MSPTTRSLHFVGSFPLHCDNKPSSLTSHYFLQAARGCLIVPMLFLCHCSCSLFMTSSRLPIDNLSFLLGQAEVPYSLPNIPFLMTPNRKAILYWLNFASLYNFCTYTYLLCSALSSLKSGSHLCLDSGLYHSINILLLDGWIEFISYKYKVDTRNHGMQRSIIQPSGTGKQYPLFSSDPWVLDNPCLTCSVGS